MLFASLKQRWLFTGGQSLETAGCVVSQESPLCHLWHSCSLDLPLGHIGKQQTNIAVYLLLRWEFDTADQTFNFVNLLAETWGNLQFSGFLLC